jgi:hypothetical protein
MEIVEKISNMVARYAVPLYGEDNQGTSKLRGSAFIIRHLGKNYLVTANHVLDERKEGGVHCFVGPNKIMKIVGHKFFTEPKNPGLEDSIDIAVVQLTTNVLPYEKSAWEFIHLAPPMLPRSSKNYLVAGFPETKNITRNFDKKVDSQPYIYIGNSPSCEVYERLGIGEATHILVDFNRKIGIGNLKENADFPKPVGMSGGPIVAFEFAPAFPHGFVFGVVGVATNHKKNEKLIKGTDAQYVRHAIERLHVATA